MYAHKRYIFTSIVKQQEDGVLATLYGEIPFAKGDFIATDIEGNQKIIPRGQEDEYIRVKLAKVDIDKNVMVQGYEEMGKLHNEENFSWMKK